MPAIGKCNGQLIGVAAPGLALGERVQLSRFDGVTGDDPVGDAGRSVALLGGGWRKRALALDQPPARQDDADRRNEGDQRDCQPDGSQGPGSCRVDSGSLLFG